MANPSKRLGKHSARLGWVCVALGVATALGVGCSAGGEGKLTGFENNTFGQGGTVSGSNNPAGGFGGSESPAPGFGSPTPTDNDTGRGDAVEGDVQEDSPPEDTGKPDTGKPDTGKVDSGSPDSGGETSEDTGLPVDDAG